MPARYYIIVLRELFLKAGGIVVMWDEAVFLFLFAVFMFGFAVRRFQKKVV